MDSDQFPTFGNHQFQEDFAQALAPDTDVLISSSVGPVTNHASGLSVARHSGMTAWVVR